MGTRLSMLAVGATMLLAPLAAHAQVAWSDHHYPGSECFLGAVSGSTTGSVNVYPGYIENSSSAPAHIDCPAVYDIGSVYGAYTTIDPQWIQLDYHDNNGTAGSNGDLSCQVLGRDHYGGSGFSSPSLFACSTAGGCSSSTTGVFSNNYMAWSLPSINLNTGRIYTVQFQCTVPGGNSSGIDEYQMVLNYN